MYFPIYIFFCVEDNNAEEQSNSKKCDNKR